MGEVVICHGPAGAGRSRQLVERRLRDFRARSPRFLYVVASRWRKHQLLQEFLETHPRAFEIPILTFQELIAALFREIGSGRRVVSETGRRWLLEAVLEAELQAAGGAGPEELASVSEVEAWVSLLQGRGLTSEPLIRLHLQREDREDKGANQLIRVFLAYQKELEDRGWEDAAGVRLRLYEALLTGSLECRNRFPGLREILFEGLIARTPVERGLVRLLADQAGQATFSLDLRSPTEQSRPFALPLSSVQECWEGTHPKWRFEAAAGERVRVRFSRPEHREAEVRTVAREIQELKARRPRLPWSRVGVACPRDESYLLLVGEVFSRLEIPWLNLNGDAVRSTNAFRVLTGYVELLWRDFRRDDLFDFLSSPWIDPEGISPDRVRLLERLASAAGFGGGREVWESSFPEWIERKPAESAREPFSVPEGCADAFRDLIRHLQADSTRLRTAGEWVSLLAGRLEPLLRAPAGPENWGRTEGQALSRLQASLREAALLWGDFPLSLSRFRSLVHRQLSRLRIFPSLDRDAVVVGSPRQLQECEFRHLFWLDFSEGRIPPRRRSQAPGAGSRVLEELSIFHGIRCRTRETVLLSSPRQGHNGPGLPSHVLTYLDDWEEVLPPEEPAGPATDRATAENVRRGGRALSRRRSGLPSAFAGVLSRPHVLERMRRRHFPAGMDLSPAQLEEYGRCGFRYFIRTMLKAAPPAPADADLSREQTRLVHRILSRYSRGVPSTRTGDLETERLRLADIVREELERSGQARPAAGGLLWEQLETWLMEGPEDSGPPGLLIRFLEEDREREAGSEPHSVGTSLGPLILGCLPSGPVQGAGQGPPIRLKGRMDRIDRSPEGYRVVVYAAGRQDLRRRIKEGWGFRLPLSLLLVRSFLGNPASGGFYHVSLPGHLQWRPLAKRGREISGEELDRLLDSYQGKAVVAAREIYSGRFPVTTLKPASAGCGRCSYSRVCRREEALARGTPR